MNTILKSLLIVSFIIIGALAASYGIYLIAIVAFYFSIEFGYELISVEFKDQTIVLYE